MLRNVTGVVIKTQNYGETHKIITIFSKEIGKFTAIARGANKPRSRMAAVTQPFIYGEFLVYLSSGLSSIRQGEVIDSVRGIREDIIKMAYTAYIMELTDKLTDSRVPDTYIYEELFQTVHWILDNEDVDIPIIMYELKLFKKAGFSPVVDRCTNCRVRNDPTSFSIVEGGLLCSDCSHIDRHAVALAPSLAKLLSLFENAKLEQVGTISVKPKNILLLRKIFDAYYDQHGGYYLKSRKFLDQLDLLR